MFETSADVMRMSFAIGFIVLVVFLSMLFLYVIFILRDVSKITGNLRDVVQGVRASITSPLKALHTIGDKVVPYIEEWVKKGKKKMGK